MKKSLSGKFKFWSLCEPYHNERIWVGNLAFRPRTLFFLASLELLVRLLFKGVLYSRASYNSGNTVSPSLPLQAQPVKMDLIKRLLPLRETIQTFKVDPQGFRKTINENPPASNFFCKSTRGLWAWSKMHQIKKE